MRGLEWKPGKMMINEGGEREKSESQNSEGGRGNKRVSVRDGEMEI